MVRCTWDDLMEAAPAVEVAAKEAEAGLAGAELGLLGGLCGGWVRTRTEERIGGRVVAVGRVERTAGSGGKPSLRVERARCDDTGSWPRPSVKCWAAVTASGLEPLPSSREADRGGGGAARDVGRVDAAALPSPADRGDRAATLRLLCCGVVGALRTNGLLIQSLHSRCTWEDSESSCTAFSHAT